MYAVHIKLWVGSEAQKVLSQVMCKISGGYTVFSTPILKKRSQRTSMALKKNLSGPRSSEVEVWAFQTFCMSPSSSHCFLSIVTTKLGTVG
jgi:hypothetical protein